MNSKNEILNRLRQVKNPDPEFTMYQWEDKDVFNDYPGHSDNLIDTFKRQFLKLSGDLFVVNNHEEAVNTLQNLLEKVEPGECKTHRSTLIDELKSLNPEIRNYLTYIDEIDIPSQTYAKFKIGISGADCLIARTGSILLRAISAGGRRLSILPPTHIVIAHQRQIVASLDDAFNLLNNFQNTWGYATIISGPSRTSDIEKQLVLGAHGPKKLIVVLVKN